MPERNWKKNLLHTSWMTAIGLALLTHALGLWCIQDLPIPGGSSGQGVPGQRDWETLELTFEEWELPTDEEEAMSAAYSEVVHQDSEGVETDEVFQQMTDAFLEDFAPELVQDTGELQIRRDEFVTALETPVMDYEPVIDDSHMHLEAWSDPSLLEGGVVEASLELEQDLGLNLEEADGVDEEQEGSIATTHHYDVAVEYAPIATGEGFAFRARFVPKEEVHLREIRQNLTFLIDRSHSIRSDRFEATKDAVIQSLALLSEKSRFNILLFDKEVRAFQSEPVAVTSDSLREAQEFLAGQNPGGIGASTDLYLSLSRIVPKVVERNEVNSVILLSDGDTHLRGSKQREAISSWLEHNEGKVTIHSMAAGRNNNLKMLGMLSTLNKGEMFHAGSLDELAPLLSKLVRRLEHPVGKEIEVTGVSGAGRVEIFPRGSRLPDLFAGRPYEVIGVTEKLENFYLFLQGKYYDRYLDIKHKVNLEQARIASEDLEALVAQHQAYDYYDRYLAEGSRKDLHRAEELLRTHKLQSVFR